LATKQCFFYWRIFAKNLTWKNMVSNYTKDLSRKKMI
jgi:hypothetical protein